MMPPDHLNPPATVTRTGTGAALRAITLDPRFAALPAAERERVHWLAGQLLGIQRDDGITRQLHAIAARAGRKYRTVRRLYSEFLDQGWMALTDGRRGVRGPDESSPADRPAFVAYYRKLVEDNQRSTDAARRALYRMWRNKEVIPGYEGWPGWPRRPQGWSQSNLAKLGPAPSEISLMRFGVKTAKKHLAQTFRTRIGLWPASHVMCDDVWHDHFVRWGDKVTRVLEFGALDVWSACRYAWGTKPRMPAGDESDRRFRELTEREFRFFLAALLWEHGYHAERGTTLILEHAKATVREPLIARLADHGIAVVKGGLTGERQAILGLWGGRAGGESNTKSHLESLHNLIHNELAALPGQTGKDRQHARESTAGIVAYQQALLDWARTLPAELAAQLQHPLLDYQTQFLPLLDHIYRVAINGRTDHRLEGWVKMGRRITEYTFDPGGDAWLPLEQIPEASRSLLLCAVRDQPDRWSRTRLLSPAEVWEQGRAQLTRANPALVWDIIGHDEARERKVRGAYIRFRDADIDDEELLYEARIRRLDGTVAELPDGETYAVMSNPYAPGRLLVGDSRGRCLGVAARVRRACIADAEAMQQSWGQAAQRNAQRMQPLRDRWQPEAAAAHDLRQHNAELGFPGAPGRTNRADSGRREARDVRRRQDTRDARRTLRELQAAADDTDALYTDDTGCPFPL